MARVQKAPAPVGVRDDKIRRRFWAKVRRGRGCWRWLASRQRNGYGQFMVRRPDGSPTMARAHRVAWWLTRGRMPKRCVLHKCDNRWCVRPDHLFVGTRADNNRDMTAKGRNVFQYRNPSLKLTARDVRAIRTRRGRGVPLKVLAERFGVAESMICRIARGTRRMST